MIQIKSKFKVIYNVIKIATYNIHRCIGRDGLDRPERIGRVLKEIDADIFALQEIASEPGTKNDVLQYFADITNTQPIEGFALIKENEGYGNALLSKIPVSKIKRINISVPNREPRGIIETQFIINNHSVTSLATHLGLSPAERQIQVKSIRNVLNKSQSDIIILLGDFNEWLPWGKRIRVITKHFTATTSRRTFPAKFPIFKLDRIWIKPFEHLHKLSVHSSALSRVASDHLPLVANVDI